MTISKQAASWIKTIKKHEKSVAAERDKIDAAIDELIALRDNCEEAWDHLQRARDALSELV